MTEEQQVDALKVLIGTSELAVHEADELKDMPSLPQTYVELEFEWRYGALSRLTAQQATNGYRFSTRAVADSLANARNVERLVEEAVRGQRITVGGRKSTPIQRESGDAKNETDGRYSGWTTWTYVL